MAETTTSSRSLRDAAFTLPEDFRFKVEDEGHQLYLSTEHHPYTVLEFLFDLEGRRALHAPDADSLAQAWRTGTPMDRRLPFSVSRWGDRGCYYCDSRDFWTDGFTIWPDHACLAPDGIKVSLKLEVPSGKLVIGNDFRRAFPPLGSDDFNVNKPLGIKTCMEAYEKVGMIHPFVGNSCPALYPLAKPLKDYFVLANPPYDADGENKPIPNAGDPVASVVTDLWWVCIVDYDRAKENGMDPDKEPAWHENRPVEVTPGTYVLDYHVLKRDFDRDGDNGKEPVIYADFYREAAA